MQAITDEYMNEMRTKVKGYTVVVLRPGPRRSAPGADAVIREHGRRNYALRADGALSIVCPIGDSELAGVGIFNRSRDETDALMREDPAVQEGVLTYSVHSAWSFPGDTLP